MSSLQIDQCTAKFELIPHDEYPERLFYVTGSATHPGHGKVASLRGFVLRHREEWRACQDFMEVMDEESDEMMRFSSELFDEDMNILSYLIEGGRRSGSGCWGKELNRGDIVYIEDAVVEEPFRRRGVGSWFLRQFLQSRHITANGSHVFCWPTPVPGGPPVTQEAVTAFYQKNNFRRIGRTHFLCYSHDPNHPSRKLAIADDATAIESEFPTAQTMDPVVVEEQFPLHVAIMSIRTEEVAAIIQAAYQADPASIHKKGPEGFTPTHLAAGAPNVHALRKLLTLGVEGDLRDAENVQASTPLEALEEKMRSSRMFMENILSLWDGYSNDDLSTLYTLKKALNLPVVPADETEYISAHKYGCTCGKCIEGWLSPRMKNRLSRTALIQYSNGTDELNSMGLRPSHDAWLFLGDWQYVPSNLHSGINRTFVTAWLSGYDSVHKVLEAGEIPTADRMQTAMSDLVGLGAKPHHLIDSLTAIAESQSPLGDETFDMGYEEENEGLETLDKCANDLAFSLVRRKLGLDPRMQWGPYRDAGEDNAMDDEMDDSDSDSDSDSDY